MKRNLVIEGKQCGYLVADVLQRMIVAIVKQTADIVLCRIVLIKLVAANKAQLDVKLSTGLLCVPMGLDPKANPSVQEGFSLTTFARYDIRLTPQSVAMRSSVREKRTSLAKANITSEGNITFRRSRNTSFKNASFVTKRGVFGGKKGIKTLTINYRFFISQRILQLFHPFYYPKSLQNF